MSMSSPKKLLLLNLLRQSKINIDQSNLLHKTFSPDSFKESFLNFINLGNQ